MASGSLLTDDELDDLLYLARANELDDLRSFANELATTHTKPISTILRAAQDPESGNTVLHYAAANGHLDVLEFVKQTAITAPQAGGSTEKEQITEDKGKQGQNGQVEATSELAELVNKTNAAGNTALHWAALNGHLACVECLVKGFGADVTVLNAAGHDAVYEAEVNGKDEVMQWLLREGGSVLEQALGTGQEEGGASGLEPDYEIEEEVLGETSVGSAEVLDREDQLAKGEGAMEGLQKKMEGAAVHDEPKD